MLKIGLTTSHGMIDEQIAYATPDVTYSKLKVFPKPFYIRSPLKCYLYRVPPCDVDLVKAVLAPVRTSMPWVCSLDSYATTLAFSLSGVPLPKFIRKLYIESLFRSSNCKRIIFWSEAARQTMEGYGGVTDPTILEKSTVLYPGIRTVPNEKMRTRQPADDFRFLFSGDFFRKGGANVIDAFEDVQKKHSNIALQICADESDFHSDDQEMKRTYLRRIRDNPKIQFGRVSRSDLVDKVLPRTDAYLLPTYAEAFGFAILEAMAFGVPVISTNIFAIPEIITDDESGLLIDLSGYDTETMFKGYRVNNIPKKFHEHVSTALVNKMLQLIECKETYTRIRLGALARVRERFSLAKHNESLREIYLSAVARDG